MLPPIAVLSLLGVALLLVAASIKRIPEGQVYTLRRLGRPVRTLTSGTHVVLPLLERVAHKISLSGHALQLDERVALNDDGAPSALRGKVYWQVLEPDRADAVIERADELIRARTLNALREAENPAAEDGRARNARLKQALNAALRERGVLVTRVDVDLAA